MTKEEIKKKIEELKIEKNKYQHEADLQDVFQHSYKIFLNSVYGFTGTQFSPVYNRDIAESVTLTGQATIKEMVKFTNKCLNKIGQTSDDSEWVIAGDTDSTFSLAKILLNNKYITIAEAFEIIANNGHIDKLQNGTEVAVPDMDTFVTNTLNGLQLIKNISRHKTPKEMYSIKIPGKEELKVTKDHSLMVMRNEKIIECKPNELKAGDKFIIEK